MAAEPTFAPTRTRRFTDSCPWFTTVNLALSSRHPPLYRTRVILPNNAALHATSGQPCTTRRAARASAAFNAAVELHRLDALTDSLKPPIEEGDMYDVDDGLRNLPSSGEPLLALQGVRTVVASMITFWRATTHPVAPGCLLKPASSNCARCHHSHRNHLKFPLDRQDGQTPHASGS
jgi:hypothetical protein